jgi:hypothetical protein
MTRKLKVTVPEKIIKEYSSGLIAYLRDQNRPEDDFIFQLKQPGGYEAQTAGGIEIDGKLYYAKLTLNIELQ